MAPAPFLTGRPLLTLILFFASGFAGLVYQVLWMKELSLLFGNTAQAAATTLAAFFLGLAGGSWVWGRRVSGRPRPLRTYARLEAAVTISALAYFALLELYHAIYAPLYTLAAGSLPVLTAVKFVLAVGILLPPAFFMGGTLPVMSEHLLRSRATLGRSGTLLYAINTAGAALGAYVAGFHLPLWLGFNGAYALAMGITGAVALLAWWLSRAPATPIYRVAATSPEPVPAAPVLPVTVIRALAFGSGFAALAVEVLWTRMFAQVLQNSVYTFAVVLVSFLLALALGAGLASLLARRTWPALHVLLGLLLGSGVLVSASPLLFHRLTDGLRYLGGDASWTAYVGQVFGLAAAVILPPTLLLGAVFPYLWKLSEALRESTGRTVGRLTALNTAGAIFGSLCAGFLLLEWLGLWPSIAVIGLIYLGAALLLATATTSAPRLIRVLPVLAIVLVTTVANPGGLPRVRIDPASEALLEVWEGSGGTVAVVNKDGDLRIKVNNYYTLGGTGSRFYEERQGRLPVSIHPDPRRVLALGMGTGISAGAALQPPVERLAVAELVPEVITAARKYFRPYTNGLFTDPRVSIFAEDGRNFLLGTRERYDVIIADLFVPWKAGTGSLYSREHYAAARDRLAPGGLYAQWLPMYQLTEHEVGIIARTMLAVFGQVTAWRGDFFTEKPILLLLGQRDPQPLEPHARLRDLPTLDPREKRIRPSREHIFAWLYAGNLTASAELFAAYPVNSDNRPHIEYGAPLSHRGERAGEQRWLTGTRLVEWVDRLLRTTPPDSDPYLARLSSIERRLVYGGLLLHVAKAYESAGLEQAAATTLEQLEAALKQALPQAGSPP